MNDFLKRFSMVDFLGIFFPGALFTLLVHQKYQILLAPFEAFFGKNQPVQLSLYFIGVSYFFGSLFHELGSFIEKGIRTLYENGSKVSGCGCCGKLASVVRKHIKLDVHKSHLDFGGDVRYVYKKSLICGSKEQLNGDADYRKAGEKIYRYVRLEEKDGTVILMASIATMHRTLLATVIVLCILFVSSFQWLLALSCMVCGILCFHRWYRYSITSAEYAYIIFLRLHERKKDGEGSVEARDCQTAGSCDEKK